MKVMKTSKKLQWYKLFALLIFISQTGLAMAVVKNKPVYFILTQQQWSAPKTAESVLTMPAIHNVMKQLSDKKGYTLRIRYSGGEVGMLWASELKGWLVSLGLASSSIELQSGSLNVQEIELSINKTLY